MATEHLIFLSVPGLRPSDIDAETTPTLHGWANQGALAELSPTFPCVTSPVQASMWTGRPPGEHGVIANGFYHRDRREVEFWVAHNQVIAGEQIWHTARARRPDRTSAVWHAQNIKGAEADVIVTPAPIHEDDGTTKLWCYSRPEGLYDELHGDLGHFPLQHYWGPLANIESTRWILRGAAWLIARHAPNLHWIYVPHLDYAAQKFGPNSPQAKAALAELDGELAVFFEAVESGHTGGNTTYLVAGEYALTDVGQVVYPNRLLRETGLMTFQMVEGREHADLANSVAFAMVDHQLAHIYVDPGNPDAARKVADLFQNTPGVSGVYAGDDRKKIGMDHERCGEIILMADEASWFAYYWWLDDADAPPFARTVDIHRKPGYDPVELFVDSASRSIPLDTTLVRGSHGVPATEAHHRTALICSMPNDVIRASERYRDTDMKNIALQLMGLS